MTLVYEAEWAAKGNSTYGIENDCESWSTPLQHSLLGDTYSIAANYGYHNSCEAPHICGRIAGLTQG